MPGSIALVGGNEFRAECGPMDRALLARLGKKPRVTILPTAAAREKPELAAENGIRYFQRLGARAEAAMVIDPATAGNPKWVERIEKADLVYFTGGDPKYLLETIRYSPTWEATLKSWENGGMVGGSSAGAMILGGWMWAPGKGWVQGLSLLPRIAVIPHHSKLAEQWNARHMQATLPPGITLTGIDEATALVGPPWEVLGMGNITLYRNQDQRIFTPGQMLEFCG